MPAFQVISSFSDKAIKPLHGRVDIGIIRGIKNGDITSFERFYKILYPRLKNFVSQLVANYMVEDIIQDAFVKVWETRTIIDEKKSLSALIFVMVRNQALNTLKRSNNERKYIESLLPQRSSEEVFYFDFLTLDEREKMHEASIHQVNKLIDDLPEKCRKVFVMSKIKFKKSKDIAEELGISIKSVEKHISKGYKFIRKRMS